ncbi:MAG: prenyltransferase/squalene oxidase repeat-containing protein, partial [Blastopirellula sp. JB062]
MSITHLNAVRSLAASNKLAQFAHATLSIVAITLSLSSDLSPLAAQNVQRGGKPVTPERVNEAITRGVNFLRKQQQPNGGWPEYPGQPGGVTSLAMLALIECGVDEDDPALTKGLEYLEARIGQPDHTYALSLQIMAYSLADPIGRKASIVASAQKLSDIQIRGGDRSGMWTYSDPRGGGGGDNSNTQFAILALDEAAHAGATVDNPTWQISHDYWKKAQNPNGSWGYLPRTPGRGSMTAAGISSMIITTKRLAEGDATVNGESIQCCGKQTPNDAIEDGYAWLGRNFTVYTNPADGGDSLNLLYYLYAVERVGRLGGRRFIGEHDWYREGAEMLVNNQDSLSGAWRGTGNAEVKHPTVATSLALLFLAKGRRPVVVAKYKHDADGPRNTISRDWNRHRNDIANLTHFIEPRWGNRRMTWQVIDAAHATTEDLLQTPVLWISGRDGLNLTAEQEKSLKLYIEQGGFVFAEAACGGA